MEENTKYLANQIRKFREQGWTFYQIRAAVAEVEIEEDHDQETQEFETLSLFSDEDFIEADND